MRLISIIVPVYNAEKYLRKTLDSILSQTYTNWECLLIDDGSKDSSGVICDDYATNDCRFKVYHKENGGVASARQYGILVAKGDYSIHVDSDDWIHCDMLKILCEKAVSTNADIVVCDFTNVGKKCWEVKQNIVDSSSETLLIGILKGLYFGSLWNKLIRHSLYSQYNVHFFEGINYCEDVLVEAQLLKHNLKVSYVPKVLYYYNKLNENSITTAYTNETFEIRKRFIRELKNILYEKKYQYSINVADYYVYVEALRNGCTSTCQLYNHYPILASFDLELPFQKKNRIANFINKIFYSLVSISD